MICHRWTVDVYFFLWCISFNRFPTVMRFMSWSLINNMTCVHCCCSIGRYTRDLPRYTVDSLVDSAFSVWARASGLTFVRSHTRSADIMVEFLTNRESVILLNTGRGWTILTCGLHSLSHAHRVKTPFTDIWCITQITIWFSSHLSAKQDSVITHWLLISTDSLWGGEQRPVIFFWHETKLFSLRFLFHVYIMKNMETCIHSMDPEAHWLTLSAQVWASEGTRTLTTMSTGQQEKQVLDWRRSEVNRYTYKTVIYLDEFSPSCCRF